METTRRAPSLRSGPSAALSHRIRVCRQLRAVGNIVCPSHVRLKPTSAPSLQPTEHLDLHSLTLSFTREAQLKTKFLFIALRYFCPTQRLVPARSGFDALLLLKKLFSTTPSPCRSAWSRFGVLIKSSQQTCTRGHSRSQEFITHRFRAARQPPGSSSAPSSHWKAAGSSVLQQRAQHFSLEESQLVPRPCFAQLGRFKVQHPSRPRLLFCSPGCFRHLGSSPPNCRAFPDSDLSQHRQGAHVAFFYTNKRALVYLPGCEERRPVCCQSKLEPLRTSCHAK